MTNDSFFMKQNTQCDTKVLSKGKRLMVIAVLIMVVNVNYVFTRSQALFFVLYMS